MSIRYNLQLDDYWRFQKYYLLHRRLRPAFLYPLVALAGLCVLAALWSVVMEWRRGGPIDWYVLISPVIICLYPWFLKWAMLRRAKSSLAYGENSTLTIEEQYVMTATRSLETKLGWSAIHEIVNFGDYIFFFVTKNHAVILPKRVFPTQAEADSFLATAINYKRNAVPGMAVSGASDNGAWPPAPRSEI